MRSRPWQIWTIFGVCLLVVLFGMGGLTVQLLELERSEAEARRDAKLEENIRLALWRMDSFLSPIIARENAREPYEYQSYYSFEEAFKEVPVQNTKGKGKISIPSQLGNVRSQLIKLYFQVNNQNRISSPQVSAEDVQAEQMSAEDIKVYSGRIKDLKDVVNWSVASAQLDQGDNMQIVQNDYSNNPINLDDLNRLDSSYQTRMNANENWARNVNKKMQNLNTMIQQAKPIPNRSDSSSWDSDGNREDQKMLQQADVQVKTNSMKENRNTNKPRQQKMKQKVQAQKSGETDTCSSLVVDQQQVMHPHWINGNLFLLREVTQNSRKSIQGVWLDWSVLRKRLLKNIRDLLPRARLEAVEAHPEKYPTALASIPAVLVPGSIDVILPTGLHPIRISLYIAWICFFAGAGAACILVIGIVSLSERRAEFVSSVTHELRTPLTTFKMYTEMLFNNMLPTAEQRKNYLQTLSVQADRLVHLIENVLAFARLERNRVGSEIESVRIGVLVDDTVEHVSERARLADMEIVVEIQEDPETMLRTDRSAVQHILYNLVDNACKYAAKATDRRIHIEVMKSKGKWIDIRVRDHGPGISREIQKKMFKAFSKSAAAAAGKVPGVGLGLAISLRLARKSGGQLSYQQDPGGGACFILRLPRA